MLKNFNAFFRSHTILVMYTMVLVLLIIGIIASSGTNHIFKLFYFILALYGSYIAINLTKIRALINRIIDLKLTRLKPRTIRKLTNGLFVYLIVSIIVHLIVLGGVPSLQAWKLSSPVEISALRNGIVEGVPSILNYMASFNLKAFLPFLILYFYLKERKILFWLILLVGVFYTHALMQKSLIISLLVPVFIYSILNKKNLMAIMHILIISGVVYNLTIIANPDTPPNEADNTIALTDSANIDTLKSIELVESVELIEPEEQEKSEPQEAVNPIWRIPSALYERIVYVPGEMVSKWFDLIPAKRPFLYGDGYRLVARIKGTKFRNYARELYPLIRPENTMRNLKGSVNTASFMTDYANFGKIGLILSGIILSFLFVIIESLFGDDFKTKLSLNAYPVLIISSAALSTTLFSGGWFFLIVLYLVFLRNNQQLELDEIN